MAIPEFSRRIDVNIAVFLDFVKLKISIPASIELSRCIAIKV